MKCEDDTPSDGCQPLVQDRIRYFTGRHMTARDFRDGEAYQRSFRHLHNRMLHGWGIVCGLDVTHHPRDACSHEHVVVRCGLALDCCGREIVVRKDVASPPIPWDDWPKSDDGGRESGYVLLLCLAYCETLIEKVPVLYSANACSSPTFKEGRIREEYTLGWHFVPEKELEKYGWYTPQGCAPEETPDRPHDGKAPQPCEDDADRGCCLDLHCPLHHCVALAVVRPGANEYSAPKIDIEGRRSIEHAHEHLTHICWISWPHGGIVKESDFHKLEVRFDRPVRRSEHPLRPGPRGINERTFVVQYGDQREDLDFVLFKKPPYLMHDGRTAVFEVERSRDYMDRIIHVTVRCDFIVDCKGKPVDGDHLRGRLPSGNGLPGGTFESWFRLVRDRDCEQIMQETMTEEEQS